VDLSEFSGYAKSLDEGVDVEIAHPVTGKPSGWVITVAAYSSERVKAEARRIENEARRKAKARPGKITKVEEDEIRGNAIMEAAILRWRGANFGGAPFEATPENIHRVVTDPDFAWVISQIAPVAADETAYFRGGGRDAV
jgi:hypothetical protein